MENKNISTHALLPAWPGTLGNFRVIFVGHYWDFDSLVAWFSNKMGFTKRNFIHFLRCDSKKKNIIKETKADLVIVLKNRGDNEESNQPGPIHAYQNDSYRWLCWLWKFWYKYSRFINRHTRLEVEVFGQDSIDENRVQKGCAKVNYFPKAETTLEKFKSFCWKLIKENSGKDIISWRPVALREAEMKSFLNCLDFFYNTGESYSTFHPDNEKYNFEFFAQQLPYPYPAIDYDGKEIFNKEDKKEIISDLVD